MFTQATASAQWFNYRAPGVPRLPDGTPNLSAATPRMPDGKPDFTGLWQNDPAGNAEMSKALDSVKPLPWAAAVSDERKENLFRDDPPHTEALRLTERWRRPDYGHLEVVATYVDPRALREPWTAPLKYKLDPDTQPIEYVCNENERDRVHLVGKASDEKTVKVEANVLASYAGAYEFKNDDGRLTRFTIAVEADHLVMTGNGIPGKFLPISQTEFSGSSARLRFTMNGVGKVTNVIIEDAEGDARAIRIGGTVAP